jgi:hypothetical protein
MAENDIIEAPDDVAVARADMEPADAIAKLKAGETLQNVRIQGLRFVGTIDFPVRLRNCCLVRPIFANVEFQHEFSHVAGVFDRIVIKGAVAFAGPVVFDGTVLNKVQFTDVKFGGDLKLRTCQIRGKMLFVKCAFGGMVDGWELCVRTWLEFKKCHFKGKLDLRSIHCEQGLILNQSVCEGDILLRGAVIHKKLELNGTRVERMLDLSKAKLHDFVYLEEIEQGPEQRFAFLNAVGERILVRPDQLAGRLQSEETKRYAEAMQEYGLLKRTFESLHRYEQEDWAFYRFKVNQRRGCGRSWSKPWTKVGQFFDWLFLDLGCGYGANPYRAVMSAGVIILAFAAIYASGLHLFYVEKKPFPDLELTAWPNRLLISLMLSVSVFISGLSGIRDLAQSWMNVPIIIESLLGTLLWGLFIVAFSRKVIR